MASFKKSSIRLDTARNMIAKAEEKARELRITICTAVVDESGNMKCFSRMDGAPLLSNKLAEQKAWTAVSYGIATHEWYDVIKDDPPLLAGVPNISDFVILGGGFPIRVRNEVIGGIGVSGGHYTEDMKCAEAALGALKAYAKIDKVLKG